MKKYLKYSLFIFLAIQFSCSSKHYNEKSVEAEEVVSDEVPMREESANSESRINLLDKSQDKTESQPDLEAIDSSDSVMSLKENASVEYKPQNVIQKNKEDWIKESFTETLQLITVANDTLLNEEIRKEAKLAAKSFIAVLPNLEEFSSGELKDFQVTEVKNLENDVEQVDVNFTFQNKKGQLKNGTSKAKITTRKLEIDDENYTEFKVKFDSFSIQN